MIIIMLPPGHCQWYSKGRAATQLALALLVDVATSCCGSGTPSVRQASIISSGRDGLITGTSRHEPGRRHVRGGREGCDGGISPAQQKQMRSLSIHLAVARPDGDHT